MRITLNIAEDVIQAARALATREGRPVGAVLSDLARRGLRGPIEFDTRNGVPLLPVSNPDAVITSEMVAELIDKADQEDLEVQVRFAMGRR